MIILLSLYASVSGAASWQGPFSPSSALHAPAIARTPSSDDPAGSWSMIAQDGAPSPRYRHTATWAGQEMLVWGGSGPSPSGDGVPLDDGGRYDPHTDMWRPVSTVGAPSPRMGHSAV